MYTLEVSNAVKRDVRTIYLWYEEEQKGLGERFLQEFERMVTNLQQNPLNFPVVLGNKRRQVFRVFPYCNYFILRGKTIRLLAVVHGKRHPRIWENR